MPIGPGKYDDLCTEVLQKAKAEGAVIIVFGGNKGQGFSCQTSNPKVLAMLPKVLRLMAEGIEKDLNELA